MIIQQHPLFKFEKISDKWSIDQLIEYFDNKKFYPKTNNFAPIFEYFESDLPLIDILNWQPPNNETRYGITLYQYLLNVKKQIKYLKSKNEYEFQALSFKIDKNDDRLLKNLSLFDSFINNILQLKQSNSHSKQFELNLQTMKFWIGFDNILTKLHFDAAHNFNFQIEGSKIFQLISSKHHFDTTISLYPWLHPQSRKSQVDIYNINSNYKLKFFSLINEIILNEGEILYIPPMYMHRVFVKNNNNQIAINFNIWFDGVESRFQDSLFKFALPFDMYDNLQTIDKKYLFAIVLKHWFNALINAFYIENGVHIKDNYDSIRYTNNFVNKLVESRYEPLYSNKNNFKQTFDISLTNKKMENICQEIIKFESNIDINDANRLANENEFKKWYKINIVDTKEKYNNYATNITNNLFTLVNENVGEIFLVAYFEMLVEYFLTVENVYPFLKYCFTS